MKLQLALLALVLPQVIVANLVDDLTAKNLTTLVSLVTDAGLGSALLEQEPLTLLGPTNAAFAALPKATLDALQANKTLLSNTLQYHVIPDPVQSSALSADLGVATLYGSLVRANVFPNKVVTFNGKQVTEPDVEVGQKSVLHVLDGVLTPYLEEDDTLPAILSKDDRFSTLVAAVQAADLVESLSESNLTIMAPTDDAFFKLHEGVIEDLLKPENKQDLVDLLTSHVLTQVVYSKGLGEKGEFSTLNGDHKLSYTVSDGLAKIEFEGTSALITDGDIAAVNGAIHVIDTVLTGVPVSSATTLSFQALMGLLPAIIITLRYF